MFLDILTIISRKEIFFKEISSFFLCIFHISMSVFLYTKTIIILMNLSQFFYFRHFFPTDKRHKKPQTQKPDIFPRFTKKTVDKSIKSMLK